jgi:hypothetical protein
MTHTPPVELSNPPPPAKTVQNAHVGGAQDGRAPPLHPLATSVAGWVGPWAAYGHLPALQSQPGSRAGAVVAVAVRDLRSRDLSSPVAPATVKRHLRSHINPIGPPNPPLPGQNSFFPLPPASLWAYDARRPARSSRGSSSTAGEAVAAGGGAGAARAAAPPRRGGSPARGTPRARAERPAPAVQPARGPGRRAVAAARSHRRRVHTCGRPAGRGSRGR